MTRNLRRMVSGVLLCGAAWFVTAAGQEPVSQRQRFATDELIVRFRPQASRARRDAIVAAHGGRVLRRFEAIHMHRVRVAAGTSIAASVAAFQSDPDVLAAQPNFLRQITAVPNDPYWASGGLWGLQKIQSQQAWSLTTGSQTVVIANIDTGVNYNHPDLAANMWRNPGETAGNGVDDDANGYVDDVFGIDTANDDSNPMDDHGHGTHTAGTTGAVGNNGAGVAGVNWNTKIVVCKFIAADGLGYDGDAIECFDYLIALKRRGVNIRVTNNSWGSQRDLTVPFPQALKDAVDAAGAEGMLNVFAAGNFSSNTDSLPFDPASFTSPSIISVAASDQSDLRPTFSNYGVSSVDLAAPGVSITSTGINGYAGSSGTSMAAPHVAGAAALIASFNPTLTRDGIKALILNNVDRLSQWTGVVATGGRLNLFSSMLASGGDVAPTVSLVRPAAGSSFVAPAAITVDATASDADGTIAKVDFFANGSPIGTDSSSPYSIVWTNVPAGSYTLTAVATDNRAFTGTSSPRTISVTPPIMSAGVNVALAANGGVATASSTYAASHSPAGVINGERKGTPWGAGGGWNDATAGFPDWLRIDFAGAKTISQIDVFSVQDNVMAPAEPTSSMTFSRYGLTNFQLEYWTGSAWAAIPGGNVAGNRLVWKQVTFTPITTTAIRVYITGSMDGASRLTEVEVYSGSAPPPPPPPPPPTGGTNVALASNGGVATASSTYAASHAPSSVINGERKGTPWGAGGGWNDATPTFPDWLRVDFSGAKTINEIDVFSVQDNVMAPSEPTAAMTFSRHGITDFSLEYWTGSTWAPIPGGTVTGNRLVWRQITFTPITTTAIRVYITGSMDGASRLTEVEVYSGSAPPPPPPPPPTGGTNVALASNGGVATASSTYASSHAPSGVINGERKGSPWGAGGGWNDGTAGFPDWLRVDFSGAKTIHQIDVFSVQDNVMAPSEPTAVMTFSRHGLTDFRLEYWTGTTWAAIPGGTVAGNRLVWKQVTFSPITTTAIRVYITGSIDGASRLTEVEAYSSSTTTPPPTSLIGFPSDNWWNLDISNAPVDPNSAAYIAFINNGTPRRLHPDFGGHVSPGSVAIYGMPYVVVDSSVTKKAVQFQYASQSDGVDRATNQSFPFYPIPDSAITQPHLIEGGDPGNVDRRSSNDRHLLIVDRDKRHLYELWNVFYDGVRWQAGSGAFFDMNTNGRRPDGWTSADAAGLAILPGLVRYDEAFGTGEIQHAFRVTVRATNGFVFPASHRAGSTAGALPMGARLRLKSTTNISGFTPEVQRIFRAMMRYGLIVADNGSDMYISGAFDSRWNNSVLNPAFRALTASDFDVIALGHR